MTTENFTPIPDYPGYSVNARGQVAGARGLLSHDSLGRVNVKLSGKLKKVYPGELLALIGWTHPDAETAAHVEELKALEEQCRKAEAEANFMRSRADGLVGEVKKARDRAYELEAEAEKARTRVAELEARFADAALESVDVGKKKPAAKPAVSEKDAEALDSLKRRCKAAESLARKLETQRDNLAEKLLVMRVELANAKAHCKTGSYSTGGNPTGGGNGRNLPGVLSEDWE